jgi:hypothetical protein
VSRSASDLLLSPLFLAALAAWAFNDHFLQHAAPGVVSGKLGDAASMVAFPILLAATLAPLARWAGVSDTRMVDACALGTGVLLAAIKLNEPIADVYRWVFGAVQYVVGWAPNIARVAHAMDRTDVLVTPLVALPMLAIRGRLAVRLTAVALPLVLMSVLLSACASRPRGAWQGDVTVRAHGGVTASSQFESAGSVAPMYTHRAAVLGASADTSFRVGNRGAVGGTLSVASGWVRDIHEDYQRFGAYVDRFGVVALGPTFRIDGERLHFAGGALLMVAGAGGQAVGDHRVMAFPYLRFELGRAGRVRLVTQVGSADGFTWDARVFAAGLSIPYPRGVLAIGYAVGTRVGPDLHGSQADPLSFAGRAATPFESYVWMEALVALRGSSSVVFSAQGGRQFPVASLGLRWNLDAVTRPPPEGALHRERPLPPMR